MGGLTRTVNKDHLEEMFGTFGKVKSAEIAFMPRTTVSKGKDIIQDTKGRSTFAHKYFLIRLRLRRVL